MIQEYSQRANTSDRKKWVAAVCTRIGHLLNGVAHAHSSARANLPSKVLFLCNCAPSLRRRSVSITVASASASTKAISTTHIHLVSQRLSTPALNSVPLAPSFCPTTRAIILATRYSYHSSNSLMHATANRNPSSSTHSSHISASTAQSFPPTQVSRTDIKASSLRRDKENAKRGCQTPQQPILPSMANSSTTPPVPS